MGMLLLGTPAVTGKALMGGFDNSGPSYAFANLMKMVGALTADTAGYAFPAVLDSNGYPNNAPSNSLPSNLRSPAINIPAAWGSQSLVFKFSGTGFIYLQNGAGTNLFYNFGSYTVTATSGLVDSSTANFIKISGTDVRLVFNFTSAPDPTSNYITLFPIGTYIGMGNLVLCRLSDEAAVTANPNAFNPDFMAHMVALNPKTIRPLDWSGAFGHQSQLSQRAPSGAFSFFADRFPPECWAGTAAGTNTYTCSLPSGMTTLIDGAAVTVQFTNANTLSLPTLNVGSTGAVRMTTLDPADFNAGGLPAGSIWTFVYSSAYNYWTGRQGGFQQRAPIEQCIDLCNAVNAHLWYNICHRYPPAEGAALATLVKARLNSTLCFYPELGNEVWNSNGTITSFILNVGVTFGFPAGSNRQLHAGFGILHRRMMGAITTAWGGLDARLKRVMPFQAYGGTGIAGDNNKYRFQGTDLAPSGVGAGQGNSLYSTFTGSADYTASPNRPIDFADVLSYATYYSGGQIFQFDANYGSPNTLAFQTILGISKATTGVLSYASDPGYITGTRVNLQNIAGMTQINGMNVTLTRVTATTYSVFTDATLSTPVDTSAFSTYTANSGQSTLYPIVSGLTNAADQFAAGGGTISTALAWVDNDLRAGFHYNNSGALVQSGTQSLLDLSANIYPAWETIAASYDASRPGIGLSSLTVECYEGAHGGVGPSTASCTALGISTTYAVKIGNLITAYKNNPLFGALVTEQFNQFMVQPHSKTPAWYGHPGPSPWSHFTGDTYTGPPFGTPYQSWYANRDFNH